MKLKRFTFLSPKATWLAALPLIALSLSAEARKDDLTQQIVVDADRQEVHIKDNRVTFYDNVVVTQGTIKMHAEELSVYGSDDKGSEVMVAKGNPATFFQILDNGKPIEAEAAEVRYELGSRTLTLTTNAQLRQEESQVTGHMIRYSIEQQEMVAEGDNESRVTTIFLPQQLEELEQSSESNNE